MVRRGDRQAHRGGHPRRRSGGRSCATRRSCSTSPRRPACGLAGAELRRLHAAERHRAPAPARGLARRRRSTASCSPRRRRCTATPSAGHPEDRCSRPCRRTGRPRLLGEHLALPLLPQLRRAVSSATSASTGRASGPTWRSIVRRGGARRDASGSSATGASRDFTYVEDIVRGRSRRPVERSPGSTYNLGGGSRVSMVEALSVSGRAHRREAPGEARPSGHGEARDTAADISAALRDFGYAPAWSLERGCASRSPGTAASACQSLLQAVPRVDHADSFSVIRQRLWLTTSTLWPSGSRTNAP